MVADLRERLMASYPAAVVRRFFDLELLDRSFAIAAQAFVALLPLIIVVVSAVLRSDGVIVAEQINDRFGLEGAASVAVEAPFRSESTVIAVSWLALAMALLSAFSLSRRLSRTYGLIFGVPGLGSRQLWRGLVWIGVQMALMTLGSGLRTVGREGGALLTVVAVVGLLVLWLAADTAALRLLVPSLPWSVLLPTAVLSMVGRIGLWAWAAIYMPRALTEQAIQFGPIGVTFVIFTFLLVGVLVLLAAPLLVSVWQERRSGALASARPEPLPAE